MIIILRGDWKDSLLYSRWISRDLGIFEHVNWTLSARLTLPIMLLLWREWTETVRFPTSYFSFISTEVRSAADSNIHLSYKFKFEEYWFTKNFHRIGTGKICYKYSRKYYSILSRKKIRKNKLVFSCGVYHIELFFHTKSSCSCDKNGRKVW